MGSTYRPQGSEKIENNDDKLNRIKVISGINNKPTITENEHNTRFSTVLHEAVAADGQTYGLIQEGSKVYIKQLIAENYEYLNGDERHYAYKNYSQAFKQLNLLFKDISKTSDYSAPINLLEGGLNEKKNLTEERFVLKQPVNKAPDIQPPVDDMPPDDSALAPPSDESSEELNQEFSSAEAGMNADDPVKTIQKMVGKLTQQMRTTDDAQMSSEFQKSILNSVISAINLETMEDADILSVVKKLKGEDNPETMGDEPPAEEFTNDEGVDYNTAEPLPDTGERPMNEIDIPLNEYGRDGTPTWDDQVMPEIVETVISNLGIEVNPANENDIIQGLKLFLQTYSTDQNQTEFMKQIDQYVNDHADSEKINYDVSYSGLSPTGQEVYDQLEVLDPSMGELSQDEDPNKDRSQNNPIFQTSTNPQPALAAEEVKKISSIITEALNEK